MMKNLIIIFIPDEFDYEYVYDYYLFCEDKCIAEVHLEYLEEPIYDGMSFKWNSELSLV